MLVWIQRKVGIMCMKHGTVFAGCVGTPVWNRIRKAYVQHHSMNFRDINRWYGIIIIIFLFCFVEEKKVSMCDKNVMLCSVFVNVVLFLFSFLWFFFYFRLCDFFSFFGYSSYGIFSLFCCAVKSKFHTQFLQWQHIRKSIMKSRRQNAYRPAKNNVIWFVLFV